VSFISFIEYPMQVQVVELTPGGADIKLTNVNKEEYTR
jgi:hypothetical protein